METNTELLNRIEAHIKGRLAVAESRAASSELYEGKKIAYTSILGFVNSLRAELAATTTENTEADFQAEYERYMESRKDDVSGHAVTLNLIGFARHFAEWGAARLLADAIKADIFDIEDGTDAAKLIVSIPGAKTGDKVYIITENTEAAPGAPIAFEHRILGRADITSCCD